MLYVIQLSSCYQYLDLHTYVYIFMASRYANHTESDETPLSPADLHATISTCLTQSLVSPDFTTGYRKYKPKGRKRNFYGNPHTSKIQEKSNSSNECSVRYSDRSRARCYNIARIYLYASLFKQSCPLYSVL